METDVSLVIVTIIILIYGMASTDCRQMCWSCQFQSSVEGYETARGKECIEHPQNLSSVARIRCPGKCIINARFDAVSLTPTFFMRGCMGEAEDGCTKIATWYQCVFGCDGDDYCNDQTSFDVIENEKEEKEKREKAEKEAEGSDDMAASLYCLIALIAVCAVGYFVKKRYCTQQDSDEESGVT